MSEQIAVKIKKEYLNLVPRPRPDQYRSLKNSIKTDGLQIPIVINENGIILDGYTRYQACKELNTPLRFEIVKFENETAERKYIIETNLSRRQLSLFRRGEVAFDFYKRERSGRYQTAGYNTWKTRRGEKYKKQPRLLKRYAEMIGTSASVAHQLVWLVQNADEETKEKLRTEQITINAAYRGITGRKQKLASEYGKYLRYRTCLNCRKPTVDATKIKCHVHTQVCCNHCGWGI